METDHVPSIICLPDEIIIMILHKCYDHRDLLNFGSTCKHYNGLVRHSKMLWKNVYKQIIPQMVDTIAKYGGRDWYNEVKEYRYGKQVVFNALEEWAIQNYERINVVHFYDVCIIINSYALTRSQGLYYTVHILQDIIKKCNKILNKNICEPPYTLTSMHYAKCALRYYFHAYLCLKWGLSCFGGGRPSPLRVVNYFVQWVYCKELESDRLVDVKIAELAKKVEQTLGLRQKGLLDHEGKLVGLHHRHLFAAISDVMYKQRHVLYATDTADFDTLDVVKVLENKCGHHITLMAIYQAVAQKFGVHCEFYVFPNHLFLTWYNDWNDPNAQGYIVDPATGSLKPKGRCPFVRGGGGNNFRYNEHFLIGRLYMEFNRTMGYIRDWNTSNAHFLADFMGVDERDGPYSKMWPTLRASLDTKTYSEATQIPLQLKYLSPIHLELLLNIFRDAAITKPQFKPITIKPHHSRVKYAVGMICTHADSDYKCVIRGWDATPDENENTCLDFPDTQPIFIEEEQDIITQLIRKIEETLQQTYHFTSPDGQSGESSGYADVPRDVTPKEPCYYVLAVDQSSRCVSQKQLLPVKLPSRMVHLEDHLAPEFTHYDGHRYVPNSGKSREYPQDEDIALMYRTRNVWRVSDLPATC